jgi:hypothetical protein
MIRTVIVAALLLVAPAALCRAQDVSFIRGANTTPVRLAEQALRQAMPTQNVAISEISAALIDLNDDGSPELLIHLSGSFCGSGGCSTMIFERGTTGWIKIGDWLAGYVSVTDIRDAGWLRIVLDHTTV